MTETSASATLGASSRLYLGAAYYPEHWPEERWPQDIQLMKEAGLTVARMAEFAWSTMEPEPGKFNFGWLDRAIAMLAEAGIVSVLGTPTAAPPAWLVQQYPDLMAVNESGRRVQFGDRCHSCVNSPEFRDATRRIVGAMGEHFGSNPNVIGWQIDNEFNRVCYCDRCRALFQRYLADRFGALDSLNAHWSTAYWSQTYSAWEQIPIPIGPHNPGLMLEFKRFITDSYRGFQKLQLDALRPLLRPGVWITHNYMSWFDGFDHYTLAADLDLAASDWYIGSGHNDYLTTGAIHDLTRGFKRRNFWLMETQPGHVTWSPLNTSLDKGEARTMAWQAVAHGADAVLYWQWRSALGGQEQYHGTLVDPSGQPRPFYEQVQQLGREFAAVSSLIVGSTPKARVAMLNSYESHWSLQWQRHHRDFNYVEHFNHYYRPLAARNVTVDVLGAETINNADQLLDYKLVITPALAIVNEQQAEALRVYVTRGGHLVLTIRCGMKDGYNALLPSRQPGPLSNLAHVEVEDYYALQEPVSITGNWFQGDSRIWAERLKLLDSFAQPIAHYGKSNGWLDDQVAVAVCATGSGLVYYVGAYLDGAAQQALLDWILRMAFLNTPATPAGVEMRTRITPEGKEILFVINHTPQEQTVELPWPGYEHLSNQTVQSKLKLVPYGVTVFTQLLP